MITDRTRQITLIGLFGRTAQLMVAELVDRLAAAGYPDLPAATHPVFENLDRDGTRLTDLAERRHDPPVDGRADRHARAP